MIGVASALFFHLVPEASDMQNGFDFIESHFRSTVQQVGVFFSKILPCQADAMGAGGGQHKVIDETGDLVDAVVSIRCGFKPHEFIGNLKVREHLFEGHAILRGGWAGFGEERLAD